MGLVSDCRGQGGDWQVSVSFGKVGRGKSPFGKEGGFHVRKPLYLFSFQWYLAAMRYIPILLLLASCQVTPPAQSSPTLPPVQVRLDSNRYFLPECPKAMEIPRRLLLELPTAQEAELSGYMPAATCTDQTVNARLAKEKELFGEMRPTAETERRRDQTLLRDAEYESH